MSYSNRCNKIILGNYNLQYIFRFFYEFRKERKRKGEVVVGSDPRHAHFFCWYVYFMLITGHDKSRDG
jgi:hypothetical protein